MIACMNLLLGDYALLLSCQWRYSPFRLVTNEQGSSTSFSTANRSFSRESPSRFKKEMMKAVECNNSDRGLIKIGLIEIDSLNRILVNIGRSDQLLTEDEIVTLMRDAGCASSGTAARTIPATTLYELV